MSRAARRLAAITVLFLGLAIIAVLGLRWAGFEIGSGQVASPTPIPASTSPQPSGPASPADPLLEFARIEDEVRALRELPAADIGPPEVLTRPELAEVLPGLLEPVLDNTTLRALGLLTAEQDIVALTEQLYTAQVLGYYDFDGRRMVVVSDAGLTPLARTTYAHEYTHAMQDAAFDTGATHEQLAGQQDRELALIALEEGDATTAMVLWALDNLTSDEMAEITSTPLPDMSGIPGWMVQLLEFPYLTGAQFVGQLYLSGGWEAVDAAYDDPPSSTEQVIHPDAYTDGEAPLEVEPVDLSSILIPCTFCSGIPPWTPLPATTLGEAWIRIWLEGIGVDPTLAARGADGWGGDRLMVTTAPDGAWALGWRIAWDAPIEATEFEDAYTDVSDELPFATRLIHVSDRETVILHASSANLLELIAPLAAGSGG